MAEEAPQGTPKKSSVLSGNFHGVPKPVLALGGGLFLYLGYRWYKNRAASSSSTASTAATTPTADSTTGTGSTGSGSGGVGTGSWGGQGGGGGAIDPLTGQPYAPGVGSLAPPSSPTGSTPQGTTSTPVGTTVATGAVTPTVVTNANGGTDQAAVDALTKAVAARAKALASGNATAIANATANVKKAQARVDARNAAAATTAPATDVTSVIPGGAPVDVNTYSQQVVDSGSGTGKSTPTGLSALTQSNGNTGAVAPTTVGVVTNANGGTDQAAVDALNKANAARQTAIASGNKTALANATANVKAAQAVVASRNKAA